MLSIEPIYVYVPLALALHVFVAWHVWHARREANDAMDYVMSAGAYAKDGGLVDDIMVLVNERIAGGAIGATGELMTPLLKHAAARIEAALNSPSTPPQRVETSAVEESVPVLPAK